VIKATWLGEAISDNRRLIQGKGRMVANPKYRAFKAGMAWAIKMDTIGFPVFYSITGRVSVILRCAIPTRMDISAIIKAALDAIQLSGAIRDDNQVDRLSVWRVGKAEGKISTIVFEVEELTDGGGEGQWQED
jgi:Holliday junction resolvase RusA-like endonuclease